MVSMVNGKGLNPLSHIQSLNAIKSNARLFCSQENNPHDTWPVNVAGDAREQQQGLDSRKISSAETNFKVQ